MTKPRTGIYKTCLNCKKEYYIKPYLIPTSKYCSRSCGAKYVRIQIKRNCEICGKDFEHISSRASKAKYCSNPCRYIAHKNKGRTEYKCHHCHKQFNAPLSTKRKYCSRACVQKESKVTYNQSIQVTRKNMRRGKLINECVRCKYNSNLEILGIHHIDRNPKNNTPSNLEVLCPNCHSIEHRRHISH